VVSAGYELGSGVFRSLRVWAAALAFTFALSEGAGFGAFSYHCVRFDPFAAAGPQCTLTGQALVPPAVSWPTFAWDVATLWLAGFLDGGFVIGLFIAALAIATASRLSSAAVIRVFSFWPILLGSAILCVAGYDYEIHATLATGLPQVLP